ncbi:hypothetical protein NOX27_11875 [Enterobacter kobei]|nr:hypothetical protein [Enterobacter kobei]MCQ4357057.1 hypothetical protein [Enterobacter kobei]
MKKMLAAAALVLGMGAAHADDGKTLYFYNWTEYGYEPETWVTL